MREIKIKQSTYERLEQYQTFEYSTVDQVINRALDALDKYEEKKVKKIQHVINPKLLPDLRFTKILNASVGGEIVLKPNWIKVFRKYLIFAENQCGSVNELVRTCRSVNVYLELGDKNDGVYSHFAKLDVSIPPMSANSCCEALVLVAQKFSIEFDIEFQWKYKRAAKHPGEIRQLNFP